MLYINISDEFNIDLSVTLATFQTRSRSTYLVRMMNAWILSQIYCNVLHINISDKFDVNFLWALWPFQLG